MRLASRRRKAATALTAIGLAVLVGCGSSSHNTSAASPSSTTKPATSATSAPTDPYAPKPLPQQETVTLAWSGPSEPFAPVVAAVAQDEFSKENLVVKSVIATGANQLLLLDKGQADIGLGSVTAGYFNGVSSGSKTKIAAPGLFIRPGLEGFYVADKYFNASGQLDPAKMKGTTIALASGGKGSSVAPLVDAALGKYGLSVNDFTVTSGISTANYVALQTGAISGGWLSSPQSGLVQTGNVAKQFAAVQPGGALAYFFVSGSDYSDPGKKAAVAAFFRAMQRTIANYGFSGDYHQNAQVVAALAKAAQVPDSTITANPPSYTWTADLKFDSGILTTLQQGWLKFGGILTFPQPIAPSQVVDQSVVPGLG